VVTFKQPMKTVRPVPAWYTSKRSGYTETRQLLSSSQAEFYTYSVSWRCELVAWNSQLLSKGQGLCWLGILHVRRWDFARLDGTEHAVAAMHVAELPMKLEKALLTDTFCISLVVMRIEADCYAQHQFCSGFAGIFITA
jgi:hypothetical protein